MHRSSRRRGVIVAMTAAVSCFVASGCESLRDPISTFVGGSSRADDDLAEEHRASYRESGDDEAIRWILVNRVKQGMTIDDVAREIGVPGERQFDVPWKNAGGTSFQLTDKVYKWGPDRSGTSYPLAFRDGLLVNYDPRDYK